MNPALWNELLTGLKSKWVVLGAHLENHNRSWPVQLWNIAIVTFSKEENSWLCRCLSYVTHWSDPKVLSGGETTSFDICTIKKKKTLIYISTISIFWTLVLDIRSTVIFQVFNTRNDNEQDAGFHFSNCISQGNYSLISYKHGFYKSAQGMALCRVEATGSEATPVVERLSGQDI